MIGYSNSNRSHKSYHQWTFSGWKLYGEESDGEIDDPAKLLCLRDVAAAGLIPELSTTSNSSAMGAACLNGPKPDFIMGDATYAPTPGPPPE